MASTWILPAQDAPFNVGTALLLTDGTVFAQDDFTVNWWRLAPNDSGDYAAGAWTRAAPARRRRLYFASAVLADGRVFVAGGEFADDASTPADLLAAEIYDPLRDTWTDLPVPDGWTVLGDAPCCVLPDGKVLVGNIATGECAIFDPARNLWRATGRKINGSASEETWTLLPDGSVLAADCAGHPRSERYVDGTWLDSGPVAANPALDLVEDVSSEIGPAILMADGRVLALGATGQTAIYTPAAAGQAAGNWSAGFPLPVVGGLQMAAKDAPACLLPNGRVLLVAGGVDGSKNSYGSAITLYESDGRTAPVPAPAPPMVDVAPYTCRLLVLPNGHAMLSTSTPTLAFYKSDPPADDTGRPVISQAPLQVQAGSTYALRGRGLNGLSQACSYGDDASMASNYPLVRLTSQTMPPRVTYCRTAGHSTMGVATGASVEATNFTVPATLVPGNYMLSVVANGISSLTRPVGVEAAAPPAPPQAAPFAARDANADKVLQEEMFWRDLNEVHLLMDFISGRADRSLTDMKMLPDPAAPADKAVNISPQEALHRVCQVRFPPEGGPDQKASNAALLLLVKDGLNALADPARGMTVAFTAMFAGTGGESPTMAAQSWRPLRALARLWNFLFSTEEAATPTVAAHGGAGPGFAIAAYPNLEGKARLFRIIFGFLPWITVFWLLITAMTYWDVALSEKTLSGSNGAVSDASCKIARAEDGTLSAAGFSPGIAIQCAALLKAEQAGTEPYGYAGLDGRIGMFDHPAHFHLVGWIVTHFGPPVKQGSLPCTAPCGDDAGRARDISAFATIVVAVFTDYVLPMMFGVLGTLAGVMRSTTAKVKLSTLSPRDARLMSSLIPLGAVAGLSIGLIMTPSAASDGTALTLSGAGLAFLAGYGADLFFGMIDTVLMRVFSGAPPPGAGGSK